MTRIERRDRLKELWKDMPLGQFGVQAGKNFLGWQGVVAALLSFNPHLQSEFRDAVKSIPFTSSGLLLPPPIEKYASVRHRILTTLSEAINELSLPKEAKSETRLNDEQGILWFLSHCAPLARWKLLLLVLLAVVGIFVAGLRVGMIEEVRSLYIHWMNPESAQPTK